jgi:hypothetical protein
MASAATAAAITSMLLLRAGLEPLFFTQNPPESPSGLTVWEAMIVFLE